MLVLSRKTDEGFLIGADIYVKVLRAEHGRVKLGITAPSETIVMREELLIREQNSNSPAPAFEREPAAHAVSTGHLSAD